MTLQVVDTLGRVNVHNQFDRSFLTVHNTSKTAYATQELQHPPPYCCYCKSCDEYQMWKSFGPDNKVDQCLLVHEIMQPHNNLEISKKNAIIWFEGTPWYIPRKVVLWPDRPRNRSPNLIPRVAMESLSKTRSSWSLTRVVRPLELLGVAAP